MTTNKPTPGFDILGPLLCLAAKNLLFFSLFIIFVPQSAAQAQRFHLGIISGVNFPSEYSKVLGPSEMKKENQKRTAAIGAGLAYSLSKHFSIRTEIFYEERGWKVDNAFSVNPTDGESANTQIDYFYPFLTLPLLAEGKIGKKWQFFLNSGLNTSLRIGGKTITEDGVIPLVFIFPEDKKPAFDFAWVGGGGLRLRISDRSYLQSECRYYRSWTPIGVGYSMDSVIKHKGYLASLSAYFCLAKGLRE
jgi:hypothetical protein